MREIIFILTSVILLTCKSDNKVDSGDKEKIELTAEQIDEITSNWKTDSVGCLRLRDPKKMKALTVQLKLVGQDSTKTLEYLGKPNASYGQGKDRHFLYFLECGQGKTSYYNFYCHFRGDTIHSFTEAAY
jgi:hypothetical protein